MSMLPEYIDAVNGLTDNLYSKGLLKDDECFRLAKISSYEVRARDLMEMLNPGMDKESGRRLFSTALIETDQKHIYNYLIQSEGLVINLCILPNYYRIIYLFILFERKFTDCCH